MCNHTIAGIPGALACTREQGHPDGHTFEASECPDRHVEAVQS
jgi:hypothetical protein